jgi:hypothetical protein
MTRLLDAFRSLGFARGHVLEVGCLFGSFALPLRRLGYEVTVRGRLDSTSAACAIWPDWQ